MSLETLKGFASGGAGLDYKLPKILTELQGLTVKVLTCGASGVAIAESVITLEDTILASIEFVGGVPTDRLSATTIIDLRATGTLTLSGVVAPDTVTVNGKVYTFVAAGTANPLTNQVNLGASDTLTAANLAAKIGLLDPTKLLASSSGAVVTLTAFVPGTAANSVGLVAGNGHVTVSGATMSGGAATGGIKVTGVTASNKLILVYFNKK